MVALIRDLTSAKAPQDISNLPVLSSLRDTQERPTAGDVNPSLLSVAATELCTQVTLALPCDTDNRVELNISDSRYGYRVEISDIWRLLAVSHDKHEWCSSQNSESGRVLVSLKSPKRKENGVFITFSLTISAIFGKTVSVSASCIGGEPLSPAMKQSISVPSPRLASMLVRGLPLITGPTTSFCGETYAQQC
jgi:hypothetical protein